MAGKKSSSAGHKKAENVLRSNVMFAKKFRLPPSVGLTNAYVVYTPLFKLSAKQNSLENNRYAFVVSKRIDKRAVGRNRSKRRLRAIVEQVHETLKPGYDMLFVIRKSLVDEKHEVLEKTVRESLGKILEDRK